MNEDDECNLCGHSAYEECIDFMWMKEWVKEVKELDHDDMLEWDEDWVEYVTDGLEDRGEVVEMKDESMEDGVEMEEEGNDAESETMQE